MQDIEQGIRLEQLQHLLDLLIQERNSAKALDLQGLERATRIKQELLSALDQDSLPLSPEEELIARDIQHELKRNAYFFDQALCWVQESLQLVRGNIKSQAYSQGGSMVDSQQGGRLVSGRV